MEYGSRFHLHPRNLGRLLEILLKPYKQAVQADSTNQINENTMISLFGKLQNQMRQHGILHGVQVDKDGTLNVVP